MSAVTQGRGRTAMIDWALHHRVIRMGIWARKPCRVIALEAGISEIRVRNAAIGAGIRPSARRDPPVNIGRLGLIIEMRQERMSYDAIGKEMGVTRERVRQILEKHGDPTLIGHGIAHRPAAPKPLCEVCGGPVKQLTRKYCSYACNSKALAVVHSDVRRIATETLIKLAHGETWTEIRAGHKTSKAHMHVAARRQLRYMGFSGDNAVADVLFPGKSAERSALARKERLDSLPQYFYDALAEAYREFTA